MEYQDFTIDLRSAGSGRFEATVADAPIRDTPRIFFSEPIEKEALAALHHSFDRPGTEIQTQEPPYSTRELGGRLFSALFQDKMADLFLQCRATVKTRDGHPGLRLRLRFRIDDPEAAYLAALPWEWLWDSKSCEFLATDPRTPVIRDLAAAQPRSTLRVEGPLRILVVDAAPGTLRQLNLKLEIERMSEALDGLVKAGQVELLELKKVTPEALRDALRVMKIHVLHFMGHGGYDSGSGAGAIFFVAGEAKDQVDGDMLATYLKSLPSLRLVVLNACKTARYACCLGAPFNEGVASAVLTRTGIPAVVANQYSISDPSAISFSQSFYSGIAAGEGIDEALTEARLRLNARNPEWATPVLFLTARDGKVFAREPFRSEGTVRVINSQPEAVPVRLGVRSIMGWGGDMEKRNDAVLDLKQYFDDRYIKEKPWWQEKVFPELRAFLLERIDENRPLLLDFAAHSSIAFAAGWLLEPKSGLDVRVRQRTGSEGEFEWSPKDGKQPEGLLWLDRPDIELDPLAADVAVAVAVSQPNVARQVQEFIQNAGCPIGHIVDAEIAPEPGPRSVLGGTHALRLAHALLPRLRRKRPEERGGHVHFFCACPNALAFYLGQLSSSLEGVVLYEYPFRAPGAYGRYQKSIELPSPGERKSIPKDW